MSNTVRKSATEMKRKQAAAKAAAEKGEIVTLCFAGRCDNLAEAGVLLREAVGQIKVLGDSLLGAHPTCAENLQIDGGWHQRIRKFKTAEDLAVYKDYIRGFLQKSTVLGLGPQPHFCDCSQGFSYTVGSGRAEIALYDLDDGTWAISGACKLRNPYTVEKNIRSKGLEVSFM